METSPPQRFRDAAALDAALSRSGAAGRFLLFKHSHRCPVSVAAFDEYERFVVLHPDLPTAWIDVIGERDWSLRVADRTTVKHESPQAILLRDGAPVWHASHGSITVRALETAVTAHG